MRGLDFYLGFCILSGREVILYFNDSMEEMKHDDKMHMGPHGHHHKPWQSNWKSPVSLGVFFIGLGLGFAALTIGLQSLSALGQELHPAAADSSGMSQQEMQQLMQQAPASSGATTGTPTGGQ